jgi:DNA polymerase I/DNA polymerase-2
MRERFFVIDADYTLEDNKGVVLIYCKDYNGKTVLVKDYNFFHYFYAMSKQGKSTALIKRIKKLDERKLKTKILKIEKVKRIWKNKETELIKITVENPRKLKDVRDAIKHWVEIEDTFEYDLTLTKRYLIDKQILPTGWIELEGREVERDERYKVDRVVIAKNLKPVENRKEPKLKILAFDTEFVEEGSESKLIMLSLVSNTGNKKVITNYDWDRKPKYVEVVKSEKEIIEKFIEIVDREDPDFICSYNGDGFDFPRIKERADKLKLSLKLGRDDSNLYVVRRGRISSARTRGRVHIDLFNFVSHILAPSMRSEVLTLDEVAQELLGIGKKKLKYKEMVEIWTKKKEVEKIAEYCLRDSELTIKLSEHLLPQIFAISKLTGQLPFDASRYTYSQLVEAYFVRKAFADKVLVPNRPKAEEIEKRRLAPSYKGAIVIEPKKGIHSDILVFDFRSLYPTIIVTHNIDPWTFMFSPCKDRVFVPNKRYYFCKDKKGFIPKYLENLIESRKKIKQVMKKIKKDSEEYKLLNNEQFALKTISNATYGYFGFFGSKWYRRECGEAAAAFGRYYISQVIETAKKEGFEVIYGDTDSLMARYPKEHNRKKLEKLGENFARKINRKLPGIIEIEFRGLYQGGIFVARERGEVGAKKRYALIDYEGNLEIRGFETVRRDWCELAKKIQRQVLVMILRDRDPKKAVKLVRDTIEKIRKGKVDLEDLIIYEQITRPLSQYEQIGPHVKAAMKLREKGFPVGEGTIIQFIIVKGTGSISDRAMPVELAKPGEYDPEYYINHQILPASMRVLKALGYTKQEILSGKIQKRLVGFLR